MHAQCHRKQLERYGEILLLSPGLEVMDQLQGGRPRIIIGARACGDRVCIWMVVTIGRLLAHGSVMVA